MLEMVIDLVIIGIKDVSTHVEWSRKMFGCIAELVM